MAMLGVADNTGYHACMTHRLTPEERDTFRDAIPGVQRHRQAGRISTRKQLPSTRPARREADEREVIEELLHGDFEPDPIESIEALAYRGNGIQDSVWRRLRRGHYRIAAELDLHGLNRKRAYQAVTLFLDECQASDRRCVRIIHGKGHGSPNTGPVIRTLLDGWLRRRKDVLAFCAARPHDGGTGAAYILLRAAHD